MDNTKLAKAKSHKENTLIDTSKTNNLILLVVNISLTLYIATYLFSRSISNNQKTYTIIVSIFILIVINIINRIKFFDNRLKYIYPIFFSIGLLIVLANERGAIDNIFIFFPIITSTVLYGEYTTLVYSGVSTELIMIAGYIFDKDLFFSGITLGEFFSILISLALTSIFFVSIIRKETSMIDQANQERRTAKKAVDSLEKTLVYLDSAYSKLKDTQTQLVQQEKMASLGMLVAGVAHEINNPIGAINCNVSLFNTLISRLKTTESIIEDSRAADFVGKLEDANKTNLIACERILIIVKSLRNFARLDESEYKEADIHVGLDSTLILLNSRLKTKVEVIKDYGNVPSTLCYPNQLNQVFMNLIANAIDAIEESGKIWITTTANQQLITIKIKDSGTGMSEDTVKRIFDPGFTTKGVGVGTGLGLSIVYNIIKKHNATIDVNSKIGEGTEFVIKLPILKA